MVLTSTYILMKVLESAPSRYDRGIRLLTLGKLDAVYDRLAGHIREGQRVLDIGCGTGALTLRAALQGAVVKGIDVNPAMLEIAKARARELGVTERVVFSEMGAAELDGEPAENWDVVVSGLCFSELSPEELSYTLLQAYRVLRPGGMLLVADETTASGGAKRFVNWLLRTPLKILTYLLTGTTTRAVPKLAAKVCEAGFEVVESETNSMENLIALVGQKQGG